MNARLVVRPCLAVVLAVVLPLGLAGCSPDMTDLQQYAEQVRARKSTAIDPIPQIKPYQAFLYDSEGRRDPFMPEETAAPQVASNSKLRPDFSRNREPLEEYPLDALSMVGVITFDNHVYAMVKAPDGVVHRVALGDHMGQNYGKINKIGETEISLTETVADGFGGWVERPATLALAQ